MKIGPTCPKEFLDIPGSERFRNAEAGTRDDDSSKMKKPRTNADAWQMTHMQYYEAVGIAWPPSRDAKWMHCRTLSQREFEVVFLADALQPHAFQPKRELWNLDVNDDIKRTLGPLSQPEDGKAPKLRSAWRPQPFMTLVGTSQLVVRFFPRALFWFCERYLFGE